MVSPLATVSATNASNAAQAPADPYAKTASAGLGPDAFMKLLLAQMKNQDPMKPMDDTAFVAQLAQFSSLQQQMQTNKALALVATQQQGQLNTEVASLVGRTVTVKGSQVAISGNGTGTAVSFGLTGPAASVKVTILDASGQPVRTMDLGARPGGNVTTAWDGKDDGGNPQPAGTYTVSVSATNASGAPVTVTQETTDVLASVSYEDGYAKLILANGASAPASQLVRVDAK
jgi:flagellar basal-body rod modification protein FlgD